ncbi:unnamed protein product [Brassica oleracea var. botrytis]
MPEGDSFPKYMVHSGYKLPNYFMRPEGARRNTFLLDVGWTSYFSMHLRHKGLNREFEKIIETYTFIDFSGNRLGGHIPESIGLLKSLIVLDLSNNNFTGHIPSSLANLTQLESLDLSRNQLSGRIPQELTVLTFLAYINMSHNKLTGQIPQITQIIGQNGSSFEGNIDLCGLPLNKTCFMEHEAPSPKLPKKEHMLNWKAVAIGYGPGVLFGIAMGHVFYSYKPVLFFKLFLHMHVFSITSLFWGVFVSIFLVNTPVSLPSPLPNQIEILLAFKKEFPSPTCSHTVLTSWTRNTHSFDGVVFDNETGVVTELHLSDACLRGTIKNNSNLFKFHHLRYLDLSYNNFEEYSFTSEFGRLANLKFLSFCYSGLVGEVPSSIHNLSRLTFLDLSYNGLTGGFPLIYNLTELSYLDLSYNNFIGTIPSSLLTMPSLLNLDLQQNGLRDPPENLNSSSSSKLERLYLGGNLFSGRILEPILKLVKLTSLDLSFLNMIFPINIVFSPLKSLEYLVLSGNSLSRHNTSFTDHALPKLIELKLSYCNIFEFPKFLMTLQSLEYLDLSWNNLLRLNTSSDQALTTLIKLDLSNCYIVEFPKISKILPNLQHIDISNNRLKGKVPAWLWNLPVTRVSLSHNSLDGFEGSPEALVNSSLEMLDLGSNTFGGPFPTLPPTIDSVVASNNNFTGELPLSLCSPRKLSFLNLSHNSFSGPIPQCLGDSINGEMYLRHNNLNGKLPDIVCRSGSLRTIDVGYNHITGKLPKSLANCTRLKTLDVRSNNITDTFPFWLEALPLLQVVLLGSNRFYGSISSPQHTLPFSKLQLLDISNNNFNGSLPSNCFVNWSTSLVNILEDHRQGGNRRYQFRFHHSLPWRNERLDMGFGNFLMYTGFYFSENRFVGPIPESIGLLKSLMVLNLSNNGFTGHIPPSLAKLTMLEALDISRNQLSGTIPQELGKLSFLSYINLSSNKLTGQIPKSTQFQTQSGSAFKGNVDLCGLPLQKNCFRENVSETTQTQHVKPSKQPSHASKAMPTLNYRNTLLFSSYLIVLHFVLSFSIPLSTSL